MTAFWLGAGAMVGAALLIVLRPLLFPRDPKDPGAEESEIAVYRERLRELRQDVARGALTEADSEKAERELQAAFARDAAAAMPATGPRRRERHWITAAVIGLGLPLVSLLLYERIGAREEVGLIQNQAREAEAQSEHLRAIAQRYEAEVTAAPGDAEAWMALGRAYLALGEAGKAMEALSRAQVLLGDEPDLLADYAKAMAQAQGGRFDGGPWRLLERALAKDPDHPMTLWLAAAASLEREDRPQARAYLERLRAQLAPGSEGEKMVQAHLAMLGEAHAAGPVMGGEAAAEGQPASPSISGQSPPAQSQPSQSPAAPETGSDARVEVRVELDGTLSERVSPSDTVFVFARAPKGPRMPLAVARRPAKDLPVTIVLDDSQAMAPEMRMSRFSEVLVGARVSRSGNPMPQTGDLEGLAAGIVALGKQPSVLVTIDRVVP
ncbi:MAG: c-type cytochrome biogenesis protein CcmI [Gammaproteobacteria bacterium]